MHADRCDNISGHKCHAKGSRKGSTIREFTIRDTMNAGREITLLYR